MPYPNEHSGRIQEPSKFKKGSFRTVHPKLGVDVIVAKKPGAEKMTAQAVRFKKGSYTVPQARKAVNKAGAKSFEPAKVSKKESSSAGFFQFVFESDGSVHPEVDREHGVIRNLCILGPTSRSLGKGRPVRRVYTESCVKEAAPLYEGVMVNVNHPKGHVLTEDRPVEGRLGKFVRVHSVNNKLYGDLVYFKTNPMAEMICEAAENPQLNDTCGFSHVADLDSVWEDGVEVVNHIKYVHSVDLVADSATTRTLFESQGSINAMATDCDLPKREEATIPPETPPVEEQEMGTGPVENDPLDMMLDSLVAKYKSGDMDLPTLKKRIGKAIDLLEEEVSTGGGEGGDPPKDGGSDGGEGPPKESACTWDAAMTVLESAGVPVSTVRVKAICALGNDKDRKALAESWKITSESSTNKPKSGEKPNSIPRTAVESSTPGEFSDLSNVKQKMLRR